MQKGISKGAKSRTINLYRFCHCDRRWSECTRTSWESSWLVAADLKAKDYWQRWTSSWTTCSSTTWRTAQLCGAVWWGSTPKTGTGWAVSWHHVAELTKSIQALGFDPSKVNMLLVEMLPGTPETAKAIQFNDRMAMVSSGRLPSVACGGPLRYCTIQGSHTNMACRSLLYGAASDDPALTDSSGKLSIDRIGSQWAAAIKNGMECTVLTSAVATANPDIISLLQASGNAVQQISKEEDEV